MKCLISLITCVALVGCSASFPFQPSAPEHPDLLISMERGACFGTCPIYNITIRGDGTVEYEGVKFVKIEGKQNTEMSSEQIEELVRDIEDLDFFSLADEYPPNATDMPFIRLSITLDGRSKTISHYGMIACGTEKATEDLCNFERTIDEAVNSSQWVKQEN